jgi:hypothetical protein
MINIGYNLMQELLKTNILFAQDFAEEFEYEYSQVDVLLALFQVKGWVKMIGSAHEKSFAITEKGITAFKK